MYQVPFSFPKIKVKALYGERRLGSRSVLLELQPQGSNEFVIAHTKNQLTAEDVVDWYGLKVTSNKGVIRDGCTYDKVPLPEISGIDFHNMLTNANVDLTQSNLYLYYTVDLLYGVIYYDFIMADNITNARKQVKEILSTLLETSIQQKELLLGSSKNNSVAHATNLSNSYIGTTHGGNNYYTYRRYQIGVVKVNKNLTNTQVLDSWVYNCI